MQAFQQLCGFNTLMYYSATLFKEIGFNQPTAVGLIISGTNFIFTLFALKYIDIIGRRKIMIFSTPGMIFGLVLASIAFHCRSCTCYDLVDVWLTIDFLSVDMTKSTAGVLVDGTHYPTGWSAIVLFSMIVYVASYASGVSLHSLIADKLWSTGLFLAKIGNVPWQWVFQMQTRSLNLLMNKQARRTLRAWSSWNWYLPLHSYKLGCKPLDRFHLSISNGHDHTLRSLRFLCRTMPSRLDFCNILFPWNCRIESWGSAVDIQEGVWN